MFTNAYICSVLSNGAEVNDNKMKAIDLLELMKNYAREYRKDAQSSISRNTHMNEIEDGEQLQQRHIDAAIVDFINYIGVRHGIDYALYTNDL